MSRVWRFLGGGRHDQIAAIDLTGGTFDTINLEDNHVRKVLLRLDRGGVVVEMALTLKEAAAARTEIEQAMLWVREGRWEETSCG